MMLTIEHIKKYFSETVSKLDVVVIEIQEIQKKLDPTNIDLNKITQKSLNNIASIQKQLSHYMSMDNSHSLLHEYVADIDLITIPLEDTIDFLIELSNTNNILSVMEDRLSLLNAIYISASNTINSKSNIQKESSLEIQLADKEKEINKLKEELKENNTNNTDKKLLKERESKLRKLEESSNNLQKEIETLKANEKKAEETIAFIDKLPNEHLTELKNKLETRIETFNLIGTIALYTTVVSFIISFAYFIIHLVNNIPVNNNAIVYLTNVFFVVFPTILAFASFRQSNLKSKELEKVDEKLFNSKYLVASLNAIQRISRESGGEEQILTSINKLIDSILKTKEERLEDEKEERSLTASELSSILKNVTALTK